MEKYFNLRHFVLLTLSLAVLVGAMFTITLENSKRFQYDLIGEQQKRVVEKALVVLDDALEQSKSDVLYLSKLPVLEELYNTSGSSPLLSELQNTLLTFLATHRQYDHLRFINQSGQEVVRINNRQGRMEIVENNRLQDKSDRPYFAFTNSLEVGGVYISNFELNVENGVIERPERTVVRLATPVFSSSGQRIGIIVANLQGDELIHQIQLGAIDQQMTLDFYHYHADAHHYVDANHRDQLDIAFPQLFKQIIGSDSSWSKLLELDEHLSSYYLFSPYLIPESPYSIEQTTGSDWLIVVSLPQQTVSENLVIPHFDPWMLAVGLGLAILSIGGGISHLRSGKAHYKQSFKRQSALLEGFVGNTPDAFIIQNAQGMVVFSNQAANELMVSGRALVGKSFEETELYRQHPGLKTLQYQVLSSSEPKQVELDYAGKSYHLNVFPISGVEGEPEMAGCIIADQSESLGLAGRKIASQMRLLEAISQVQNNFMLPSSSRRSFDVLLSHFVSVTDSEFGFIGEVNYEEDGSPYLLTHSISNIAWNEETRKYYNQRAETGIEFRNLDTLFGRALVEKRSIISNDVASDPRASGTPSGHPVLTKFLGVPVFFGNKMIGMVGVANRELDYDQALLDYIAPLTELYGQMIHLDQIRKEKRLVELELVNQKNWLRMVLDTAPDGLLLVNSDGAIEMANQSAREMFGYSQQELIHHSVEKLIPQQYRHAHKNYRSDYIRLGMSRGYMNGRLAQGLRKDGETFPVEVHLSPIVKSQADRAVQDLIDDSFVICSIRDVSERVDMEKQLRQSQKMDAIGQLTGGIAHDFNNLLGVIIGNLDLASLSLEEQDCEGVRQAIENSQAASERGSKLLQRLLAFSRKQPLKPSYLKMEHVVREAFPLIRHALGSKIELHSHLDADVGTIYADEHQLENALINLAVNARDSMPDGGELFIRVKQITIGGDATCIGGELMEPGNYVLIEIEDTGEGISSEHFEHIFEPFYTTKPSGKGTGLGLSMVYGFIRQSEGYIQLVSRENIGSTFKLYLPLKSGDMEQLEKNENDAEPKQQADKTVLIVDDEEALLDSTSKLLERAGYQVLTAQDSDTALKVLREDRVDLLFSDVMMPGGMNGIELASVVHEKYPHIGILMGTGYASNLFDAPESNWLKDSIIFKPYREVDLLIAIERALTAQKVVKKEAD